MEQSERSTDWSSIFWLISDGFLDTVVRQTPYYSGLQRQARKTGKGGEKKKQITEKKVCSEPLLPSKPDIHLASAAAHNAGRECSVSHSLLQHPRLLLQPAPGIAGAEGESLQLWNSTPEPNPAFFAHPSPPKTMGFLDVRGNAEVSWYLLAADGLH